MDVNVKVTVDLGEKTVALLTGGMVANTPTPKVEPKAEALKEETTAPKPETPKAEPEKRTRRTKEQIAAEEAQTANGWDDMDDDAKLEAIKAEVTKHTKKGKSADIKFLLSNFDAGRASELAPEDYDAFFDAITRYGKGESVEKIFPGDEDLN
ncbi:MAG: hypothetical protein LIO79_07725 [Rikenellaceae bacterium]|nr:hypothetical protein [Rikenellaceae bacterium]